MVKITGLMDSIYFEPNIRLVIFNFDLGLPAYVPNARMKMTQKMGDLKALDLKADCDVAPREIEFNTDSFGFRNDADYHGQQYLVVGDSYVVGLGNTQQDMLSSQLRQKYHLDVYSLAHPADITGYARYVRGFQKKYGGNFKVFLFIYEGNDFPEKLTVKKEEKPLASRLGRYLKDLVHRYRNLITRTDLYRLTYVKYLHIMRRNDPASKVVVENIHGHRIAFSREYLDLAQRKVYPGNEDIENALAGIRDKIECIFFVPTKYRVYHNLDQAVDPIPNPHWQFLANIAAKHQIRCVNLTDEFIRESRRLLAAENKLTWWPDDTHWNKYGIAVAAKAVSEVIKAKEEMKEKR